MASRLHVAGLWCLAVLAALGLAAANVWLGDLNQDEGWYLYAARLVADGQQPYVDFGFTQGPVLPHVYAWATPLVARWGVLGGRLFTAGLGLLAAAAFATLAARLAPAGARGTAAFAALVLIALNVYQSYFFSVVKTYALSALLLGAAYLLLSIGAGRAGRLGAFAGALLLSLAAGIRISAGVAIPVALGWLFWLRRERPGHWWLAFAGGLVGGLAWLLPPWLAAPDSTRFWLLEYHAAREAGGALTWLVYRAGFVSRMAQAYFLVAGLLAAALLAHAFKLGRPAVQAAPAHRGPLTGMGWMLAAAAAGITLVHGLAPVPYDDYQVMVFPLAAVVTVLVVLPLTGGGRGLAWLRVTLLLLGLAGAGSSPINQEWFIQGRDRIWWRLKEQSPLAQLQATAAELEALDPGGRELLTQDLYLAVEAHRRVPRGLELGPFSYYPEWSEERARALHVVNRAMLLDLIAESGVRLAAFSGYGLAIQSPQVRELPATEQESLRAQVGRRYRPVRTVERFGQGATRLVIGERRAGPP